MKTNVAERVCLMLTRDPAAWRATAEAFAAYGVAIEFAEHLDPARAAQAAKDVAIVLIDGESLGGDTIAMLRALVNATDAPVIVLLDLAEEMDQIMALEVGAADVISRRTSPRLLLARLNRLRLARAEDARGAQLRAGALHLDSAARLARVGEVELPLTTSEFDVLHVLVAHRDRPVNRDTIAQHLGRSEDGGRSADMAVCRIRRKLREAGITTVRIKTSYGRGYTLTIDGAEATTHPDEGAPEGGEGRGEASPRTAERRAFSRELAGLFDLGAMAV